MVILSSGRTTFAGFCTRYKLTKITSTLMTMSIHRQTHYSLILTHSRLLAGQRAFGGEFYLSAVAGNETEYLSEFIGCK